MIIAAWLRSWSAPLGRTPEPARRRGRRATPAVAVEALERRTLLAAAGLAVASEGVTVLRRGAGDTLELLTGASESDALAGGVDASATIADATAGGVAVTGRADASDVLIFDVAGLDAGTAFTGLIRFDGGAGGGDSVTVRDSGGAGVPWGSVAYTFDDPSDTTFNGADSGTAAFDADAAGGRSPFRLAFDGIDDPIVQSLSVYDLTLNYGAADDVVTVAADGGRTRATSVLRTATSTPTAATVSFDNPLRSFSVNAGNGSDQVALVGVGTGGGGFRASLTIDTQTNGGSIVIATALALGSADSVGTVTLKASIVSVTHNGSIDTTAATGAAGAGAVLMDASGFVTIQDAGAVTVRDGDLTLRGSLTGTGGGNYSGVTVGDSTGFGPALVRSIGSGDIRLEGRGGNQGSAVHGVLVGGGAVVRSEGTGTVTLIGTGGRAPGVAPAGVAVLGTGTTIASAAGAIRITGTGGTASADNRGVRIDAGSVVATGDATVTIVGTGGGGTGGNDGVLIANAGRVSTADGDLEITGTAGSGGGRGVAVLVGGTAVASGDGNTAFHGTGLGAGNADLAFDGIWLAKTGGEVTFFDTVAIGSFTGQAGAYDVRFLDGGTISLGATFDNAGTVVFGDAASDQLAVGGPLRHLTGATRVAGTVDVSSLGLAFAAVALDADAVLSTGSGGDITVGPVTAGGRSLTFAAGTGTVSATGDNDFAALTVSADAATLNETGDVVLLSAEIGGGALRLTAGGDVTIAGEFRISGGSFEVTAGGIDVVAGAALIAGTERVTLAAAGIVTLDGTVTSAGQVVIAEGTLAGVGLSAAPVSILDGAALSPGHSPGRLTTGGLDLAGGATFVAEVDGPGAGTDYDQVVVTGAVSLGGATLDAAFGVGFVPPSGGRYVLIANDGGDAVAGTFAGLPEGATVAVVAGRAVRITYRGGDGNDVVLVADTDPSAASDRLVVPQGTVALLNLLANDSDVEGDGLRVISADGLGALGGATVSAEGTLVVDARGAWAAGLRPGEIRESVVRYVLDDGFGGRTTGTVTVVLVGRPELTVLGGGPDGAPKLRVLDGGGHELAAFDPFPVFTGAISVATADVTGDGFADVVVAAGFGGGPHVKVYDGVSFALIRSFYAYDGAFTGGVSVAAADVDGDGYADIVTGAGAGGGPHVKVFSGRTGETLRSFLAYDPAFAGGVSVAAADIDFDGYADVMTGAGAGGGPHVKVFSGRTGETLRSFFAYEARFVGGVSVAAGDVDGDGYGDLVTGAGPGGGPHVKVFSGRTGETLRSFFAYEARFVGGVSVAAGDVDGDGRADLVTGAGPGGGPHVRTFSGASGAELSSFYAYAAEFRGGVRVASSGGSDFGTSPTAVTRPLRGAAGPAPTSASALTAGEADEQFRRAVDRLEAAGLSSDAAARLRGTTVLIGRFAGPGLASYRPSGGSAGAAAIALDADGAGLGWQAGPGERDDLYSDGRGMGAAARRFDLLTAYGYVLGRELGAGPVATGAGTLADDLLPPGVRRLLPGLDLEALFGTDPDTWTLS